MTDGWAPLYPPDPSEKVSLSVGVSSLLKMTPVACISKLAPISAKLISPMFERKGDFEILPLPSSPDDSNASKLNALTLTRLQNVFL